MRELERLAGSVIVCGFRGTDVPREVRSWLADGLVAGVILFGRNLEDALQASELIDACQEASSAERPPLIGIDQEGGRVARLGAPVIELPPMRVLGDHDDPVLTALAGKVLGRQLRAIGINLDFAPVLDVDTHPENPVIGDRSFGTTPERVTKHGLAFADGLHRGGVLSCGKHFPGHGDTDTDSHLALPMLRHDRARLEQIELRPFRAAVGRIPSIMTAHVVYEPLDERPATLSPLIVGELLRADVGYDGVVFTDDLEMRAVLDQHAIEESGMLAIEAGCDVALVCSDVDAVPRLRDALRDEASTRPRFHERLREAGARVDALRRRAAELPPPVSIENALHHPEVVALEQALATLD